MTIRFALILLCAVAAGCASTDRSATIERTAYRVAHVSAPDLETLAYGVAFAHAEDNVCQTAQQLVSVRGERGRWFGNGSGMLGLRTLPNEQIDFFIGAWMDDAALQRAWDTSLSADARALARGYVAGYNRFLADHAGALPAACNGHDWVRPMTDADYRRLTELQAVQAGAAALADAILAARPPTDTTPPIPPRSPDDVQSEFRDRGLLDPALGSNAWAFGRDTAGGNAVLLGNPHFPWQGVNRFWQLHVTVPGKIDAMGAATGHSALPQIGFNRDVAWSHTVSTGKRYTLRELALVPGDATSYRVDGKPERMQQRLLSAQLRAGDGSFSTRQHTLWTTRWGPVLVLPRAGLGWTSVHAYALQDVNADNARGIDTWLHLGQARNVEQVRDALANLGLPWVNTVAADRDGRVLYADASAVPDVDAALLRRCAASGPAAALLSSAAGIAVLDGSRSDCAWRRDPASPVPGVTPIARMPVAFRSDWVSNSNDSYVYTHWPEQRFDNDIGPLVGDAFIRRLRTRAGMLEIAELVARGPVTSQAVQQQLFANRSLSGRLALPDLLAACPQAATPAARDGCAALAQWDAAANMESRGAHLFADFWRAAGAIPGVHRIAFDPVRRAETPAGLKMDDPAVAAKVWDALASSVARVRGLGLALDAPLASVQGVPSPAGRIGVHGGDDSLGVLNALVARPGAQGLVPEYGASYIQTVTFDTAGPVAQGLLTYGQSADTPDVAQLRLYADKRWPTLPFHADDVARERVGDVRRLVRP